MSKLKLWKKLTALITCGVLTVGFYTYNSPQFEKPISAKTTSELNAQKAQNSAKIKELQGKLDKYSAKQAEDEKYQKILSEKMDKQQENLEIINEELSRIKEDISDKEENISDLENKMELQEQDISEGMDAFKQRLRAIYIMGNDSLASALVGSTDFYDLLSKYELISRVSNYDNNLVNDLKDELNQYASSKKDLQKEKDELSVQEEQKENKKDEMQTALDELSADYQKTSASIESSKLEAANASSEMAQLQKTNESIENEIKQIQIKIQQEEEAKKKAAQQAAAAAAAKTTKANGDSSSSTKTTTAKQDKKEDAKKEEVKETVKTDKEVAEEPVTQPKKTQPATEAEEVTEAPAPSTSDSGSWSWPCTSYTISSGFGYRWGSLHAGIDIAGGGSALASKSGTVIKVSSGCTHNYPKSSSCGCGGGYGNYVIISHGGSYSTLYGHLASVNVSVGQSVSAGQVIGTVGSTGFSTGYHLHFEIRVNGGAVNPMSYLY